MVEKDPKIIEAEQLLAASEGALSILGEKWDYIKKIRDALEIAIKDIGQFRSFETLLDVLAFFKDNKVMIQDILKQRLEDVFNDILYEEDEDKVRVSRLWAVEIKELILTLDNLVKQKPEKTKKQDTGI